MVFFLVISLLTIDGSQDQPKFRKLVKIRSVGPMSKSKEHSSSSKQGITKPFKTAAGSRLFNAIQKQFREPAKRTIRPPLKIQVAGIPQTEEQRKTPIDLVKSGKPVGGIRYAPHNEFPK